MSFCGFFEELKKAVAAASVSHSAAVGGSVVGVVGLL